MRDHVLNELIKTEEKYVEDLSEIVNGYMSEVLNPTDILIPDELKGKERMVFINIAAIYEWHRDSFSISLGKCLNDPGQIGQLFKKSERKLRSYIVFCQNKHISERIVSDNLNYFDEVRNKLQHKLGVSIIFKFN